MGADTRTALVDQHSDDQPEPDDRDDGSTTTRVFGLKPAGKRVPRIRKLRSPVIAKSKLLGQVCSRVREWMQNPKTAGESNALRSAARATPSAGEDYC